MTAWCFPPGYLQDVSKAVPRPCSLSLSPSDISHVAGRNVKEFINSSLLFLWELKSLTKTCIYLMGYALCRRPPTVPHCSRCGMRGGSILASWGTLGRSWHSLGSTTDTLRYRLRFLFNFSGFKDSFWKCFRCFGFKKVYLCMLVSSFSFSHDFRAWIWKSGIGKPSISHWRYCKNQLSQKLNFSWFQGPFFMILNGLGTNCHDFCCPGEWLEIWCRFKVILGSSQILRPSLVGGKWFLPGP